MLSNVLEPTLELFGMNFGDIYISIALYSELVGSEVARSSELSMQFKVKFLIDSELLKGPNFLNQ